jgi:hypothetical protein
MKTVEESRKDLPVIAETDVLVVGGGPSGLAAALSASRTGVRTMIVERFGCFGGVITQSMIGKIAWYRGNAATIDAGGISRELEKRVVEMGASLRENMVTALERSDFGSTPEGKAYTDKMRNTLYETIHTECFKILADRMIMEADITPLLHCYVVENLMEGNRIRGVITESKSGREAIIAKRVIDATGDGDVAYHAKVPYYKIPKGEGEGVSVSFGCSNIDVGKYCEYRMKNPTTIADWGKKSGEKEKNFPTPFIIEPFLKAKEAGEFPPERYIECFPSGFTEMNEMHVMNALFMKNYDATNVWDLTKAEQEGREYALKIISIFRKYVPGFENARLRTFGSSLGVRETRIFDCEYNMTEHDVLNEARFEDSIAVIPEFLDGYDWAIMPSTGRYFQIPYRLVLPKRIENMFIVGRCVGGDKNSHAATRQMVCCIATGQGAGVAAAVSVKDDVSPKEVNLRKVQDILVKQDVRIR